MLTPEVTFDELQHKYFNKKTSIEYISCTTLIKKFCPEFDKQKLSSLVAKKQSRTQQDILDEWKRIAKESTDYGTLIHKCIEGYIKCKPDYIDSKYKDITRIGYDILIQNLQPYTPVKSEMLLWNHEYQIAGQSDIVQMYTSKTGETIINVADIKTNKKIEFGSDYNEDMLAPLQHLSHCNYHTYSMQLSTYAYMLQKMHPEAKINKMFLLHLDKANKWTIIPLPYMKLEVMAMLRKYKS